MNAPAESPARRPRAHITAPPTTRARLRSYKIEVKPVACAVFQFAIENRLSCACHATIDSATNFVIRTRLRIRSE
jgi:hypothetical protein